MSQSCDSAGVGQGAGAERLGQMGVLGRGGGTEANREAHVKTEFSPKPCASILVLQRDLKIMQTFLILSLSV